MRMTEQEFQSRYRILILEPTMNVETFHCGDEDLDDFIVHEANQSAVRILCEERLFAFVQQGYQFLYKNDVLRLGDYGRRWRRCNNFTKNITIQAREKGHISPPILLLVSFIFQIIPHFPCISEK